MSDSLSSLGHAKGRMDPVTKVWKRNSEYAGNIGGETVDIKLAIGFALLDAAVLYTIAPGLRLLLEQVFVEITTAFTGGTSAAIGISASVVPHEAKGDLFGGAGGELLAGLTVGMHAGTVLGLSFTADPKMVLLEAGTQIRFDRIASAFTAGAGYVHLVGRQLG